MTHQSKIGGGMKNRIEEGDTVKIDFTPLDSITQPYFYGTVIGVPQNVSENLFQ